MAKSNNHRFRSSSIVIDNGDGVLASVPLNGLPAGQKLSGRDPISGNKANTVTYTLYRGAVLAQDQGTGDFMRTDQASWNVAAMKSLAIQGCKITLPDGSDYDSNS